MTNTETLDYLDTKATQYQQENERLFKIAKKNINVRLVGNNKYYYANQCKLFTNYVLEHGYPYKSPTSRHGLGGWVNKAELVEQGISFNKYSINVGSNQYGRDLHRFDSKAEMLGFVIGFNRAKGN